MKVRWKFRLIIAAQLFAIAVFLLVNVRKAKILAAGLAKDLGKL